MPTIKFAKNKAPLEVESGANLMKALQAADIPVASSCGGDGVCVKCRIQILEGKEQLSPETELEKDLREIHNIPSFERISCQTQVYGNVKVDTTYW